MYGIPAQIVYNGGDPGVAYEYNFAYDDAGNRTSWQTVGGSTITYTYDVANKMLTAGNSTFTYDDKGNTLTETNGSIVTTYTWDYLNRLMQWQKTGETTQDYVYNANGMRVSVTPSGGTATDFLLDMDDISEETTGSSVVSSVGFDPISEISDTTRTVYHSDVLGSTRAMSDGSQGVAAARIYAAYGSLLTGYPSTSAPEFGFAGQYRYYADLTCLAYLEARYYDPTIGRFISRDPIGYSGGLNLYAYADNDPVNKVDPTGLKKCDPCKPGSTFNCGECGAQYEKKCNKKPGKKRDACLALVNSCDLLYRNPVTNKGKDFVNCVKAGLKIIK